MEKIFGLKFLKESSKFKLENPEKEYLVAL